MTSYLISIIRPKNYVHCDAFHEVAETLQYGFRALGYTSSIGENVLDSNVKVTNVLLGAHLLSDSETKLIPPGSIIYNLEQLGSAPLSEAYYKLAQRYRVWDYSSLNIENWKERQCLYPPVLVEIGYVPELRRIVASAEQDIDVLFYGSMNERRNSILRQLGAAGTRVHSAFSVYGRARDALIARAKIVLNVHFYESNLFEAVRISYLLSNSKAVVSECSSDHQMEQSAQGAFLAVPYVSLVESCQSLLRNEEERRRLEARGFLWFSQRPEPEILMRALNPIIGTVASRVRSERVSIPAKLNLGSGKDWREDYFNADIDSYWEPDAVLDFGRALPIGQPLPTERFGTVVLQDNFFDEIMANDALEHIPNLTTAMTSCLNLLKVGGLFRISVPYDLSLGAWQDPTHVRAFNERSWLYYTDWFWYMGWTAARFDIVEFHLGLSPFGEALKLQLVRGEDLARHPRAVDQMKVVLRKRLLTEAERQQVSGFLKRPNRRAGCIAGTAPTGTETLTSQQV